MRSISNAMNGNAILSELTDLRSDLTAISNSLRARPSLPQCLGFPWESSSAAKDNVLLLDAINRSILLPMMLLSTPQVSGYTMRESFRGYRHPNFEQDLHGILLIMYRNIYGHSKIQKNKYTLTDEDSDGILIEESNWMSAIRPGMQLSLNMVLPASSSQDFQNCPRCHEMTFGKFNQGQQRRW